MPLLSKLLALPAQPLISLVGAGGKTTTMYTLSSELTQQGQRVITTTTTQIFTPTPDETDILLVSSDIENLLEMVNAAWEKHQRVTVAANINERGKLMSLSPEHPYELLIKSGADAVIIEADGAKHLKIKAPAPYEPVIPAETNIVMLVMSAEAINQPLNSEIAHRPERIAAVVGMHQDELLTPERIARLMTDEQGGLRNVPPSAQVYLLITHAIAERSEEVRRIATLARQQTSRITGVLWSERVGEWDEC